MCGIFGYIGDKNAPSLLLNGLRKLEYRGYDSAGIAVLNSEISISKCTGRVSDLEKVVPSEMVGKCGIAHTRWATHGAVTDENAHPHLSEDGSVAIIHNGIIENHRALRNWLVAEGVILRSETDSEVLAHLIHRAREDGLSPLNSVKRALKQVRGTWGLCVLFANEDVIVCARNGSPLWVGLGDGEAFVASDSHVLTTHTRDAVHLEDGDLAVLTAGEVKTSRIGSGLSDPTIITIDESWGEAELGDFPHFMLKEIHEQPESLRQCISGRTLLKNGNGKLGGIELSPKQLLNIPHIRLIGCGTALHACQVGRLAIEEFARVPTQSHVASEFKYNNPVISPNALYFAVSQSGETADTLAAVKEIQLKGGQVMGIVNVVGSSIARQCGRGIYIHSGPEQAVASTKAFSNMVASLAIFSIQLGRARNLSIDAGKSAVRALNKIPKQVENYLANQGSISEAVEAVKNANHVLFLGRGPSAPVAREGALKLMEVAYIPCLAYPAGEMKHGPIALLEKDSPVVVICPNDKFREKTLSNVQECKARGAKIILIHEEGDEEAAGEADIAIAVPKTHNMLSPLLTVIPLQLLAYHTAVDLGCDVDKPRNLAKSVTVE
ncbi:MAG: glutamine--fructose-6-phosphate transaminase (isomerizing) [Euryarchaeota archaeon]|nr:glutamine--fructose-6-phosphate transaminase (isomerizing) [Euryarchaeota archaeon]|tara:strand:+ start:153 stop:1976 length:1824 start_codon:yes stop_codon:yes gene_type:complete